MAFHPITLSFLPVKIAAIAFHDTILVSFFLTAFPSLPYILYLLCLFFNYLFFLGVSFLICLFLCTSPGHLHKALNQSIMWTLMNPKFQSPTLSSCPRQLTQSFADILNLMCPNYTTLSYLLLPLPLAWLLFSYFLSYSITIDHGSTKLFF